MFSRLIMFWLGEGETEILSCLGASIYFNLILFILERPIKSCYVLIVLSLELCSFLAFTPLMIFAYSFFLFFLKKKLLGVVKQGQRRLKKKKKENIQ